MILGTHVMSTWFCLQNRYDTSICILVVDVFPFMQLDALCLGIAIGRSRVVGPTHM
jgi:hypothetical protein